MAQTTSTPAPVKGLIGWDWTHCSACDGRGEVVHWRHFVPFTLVCAACCGQGYYKESQYDP